MVGAILGELQTAIAHIHPIIEAAVVRAREAGYDPMNALQGLVVSEGQVDAYLVGEPLTSPWQVADLPTKTALEPRPASLQHLAQAFQLTDLDLYIILLCLAPELDLRYERLYSYLQDDVNQKRPTVNLMMNLLGGDLTSRFAVRERLTTERPLRCHHLLEAQAPNAQAGLLTHTLKLDQRLVQYFLGDQALDDRLKAVAALSEAAHDFGVGVGTKDAAIQSVLKALPTSPLVLMQGPTGDGQVATAAALCAEQGLPLLDVRIATPEQLVSLTPILLREARLQGAALIFQHWDQCLNDSKQVSKIIWEQLSAFEQPIFFCTRDEWEAPDELRARRMLRMSFKVPEYETQRDLWLAYTRQYEAHCTEAHVEELARKYRFTPHQIAQSVTSAADYAASRGEPITLKDLYTGAQAHSDLKLGNLARRVTPLHTWSDLILPEDRLQQLREIRSRAQQAHIVQQQMGFGKKISPHSGVSALFAGESGTGKTMAAEVIAGDLGLVMYKIDLSSVVSKYIGETEKNLSAIFDEAQASNAILFFDEADALFGKRSEVKDAHDRYANIEVAYLLQRIETYDGIAILATNLRQNLDEAFTRRLHFLIDFPFPDVEYRRRIWSVHFPEEAPLDRDVDFEHLAKRYPMAGGNIRNAAVAAAYLSAENGGRIDMAHIRLAIRREHQKMGRLMTD